jgi:hypothetical protein
MEKNVLNFNGIVTEKVISVGIDVHYVSSQKGSTPKTVVSVVSSCSFILHKTFDTTVSRGLFLLLLQYS